MEKGWKLLTLVVVFICVCFAFADYKWGFFSDSFPSPFESKSVAPTTPAMPEVKSEPIQSPVLDNALKLRDEDRKVRRLVEYLEKQDISILVFTDNDTAAAFLNELLVDKYSQKIFRHFSKAGVNIILSHKYHVMGGATWIDARDGVKKAAEWLATGKN